MMPTKVPITQFVNLRDWVGFPRRGHICEIHGDEFNDELMQECESNAEDGTQPNSSNVTSTSSCPDGEEIREILINYFEQNPL